MTPFIYDNVSLQIRKIMGSYTNLHAHIHRPTCQQQFENSVKGLICMNG